MRAIGLTLFFMIIYDFHLIQTEHSASEEICHKPHVLHRVLDEQCNQTNICSMPVNATLRIPVFNKTDIEIITHTMLTSSSLYQDIARLTCKYNINQIEKEDVIEVCKKLGISCSSSSNVATRACRHHRSYILANINDVNCSITKRCSDVIDPFKVDLLQANKNNSLVVKNSSLKYSRHLYLFSSLVCRLQKDNISDYPQDGGHQKHEHEQSLENAGQNSVGVIASVVLVTTILLAVVGGLVYILYNIRLIMYRTVNISFV